MVKNSLTGQSMIVVSQPSGGSGSSGGHVGPGTSPCPGTGLGPRGGAR